VPPNHPIKDRATQRPQQTQSDQLAMPPSLNASSFLAPLLSTYQQRGGNARNRDPQAGKLPTHGIHELCLWAGAKPCAGNLVPRPCADNLVPGYLVPVTLCRPRRPRHKVAQEVAPFRGQPYNYIYIYINVFLCRLPLVLFFFRLQHSMNHYC
jgi:hypothetical protein